MIISRGRRYVFVHIPKTGGTSMALALEDRAMADDILIGDTPKAVKRRRRQKDLAPKGRLWKHSTLADIDGILTPDELSQMLVFTLVRNPWDRMVSYYHWLQLQSFDHSAVTMAKTMPFAEFVPHEATRRALRANPYGHYVRDAAGVERATSFVRLEHLNEDLAPIEAHLGFRLELGRSNESARDRDWRSYYSDATAASLAEDCAADIARFDYHF